LFGFSDGNFGGERPSANPCSPITQHIAALPDIGQKKPPPMPMGVNKVKVDFNIIDG
jgi:hypothetical protein